MIGGWGGDDSPCFLFKFVFLFTGVDCGFVLHRPLHCHIAKPRQVLLDSVEGGVVSMPLGSRVVAVPFAAGSKPLGG